MPVTVDLPDWCRPPRRWSVAALSSWPAAAAGSGGKAKLARPGDVGDGRLDRGGGDEGHAGLQPLPSCGTGAMPWRTEEVELGREPAGVERAVRAGDLPPRARTMQARGSMPLPPMPQKKVLEEVMAPALLRSRAKGNGARADEDRSGGAKLPVEAGRGRAGARRWRRHGPSWSSTRNAFRGRAFRRPDAERLAALREMMADPAIDAVWFARGGYGSNRIAAEAMRDLPKARAHQAVRRLQRRRLPAGGAAQGGAAVAHGPMVQDVAREGGEAAVRGRCAGW
jgi:hypothetical protein